MFPALRLLLRDGDKIDLGARAFDVLWTLVEAGGELVSKNELIDKVWAGVAVEENNAQMSAIRKALGADRDLISTEFGRGYRLLVAKSAKTSLEGPSAEAIAPPELPYPLTALLGRADELSEVQELIAGGRLVTITGPGGIGKTRLALVVGHRLRSTSAGGVFLVEMAKIAEDELVWPAVATRARVPVLGVHGVWAGLTDRFNLLTGGRRTALPRHRTLRATVDWSSRTP